MLQCELRFGILGRCLILIQDLLQSIGSYLYWLSSSQYLTFIVSNIVMLIRKIVFFRAHDIVNYPTVHLFSGAKIDIVIFTIFPLASTHQPKRIDFDEL